MHYVEHLTITLLYALQTNVANVTHETFTLHDISRSNIFMITFLSTHTILLFWMILNKLAWPQPFLENQNVLSFK